MDMLQETYRGWAVRREFHAALAELSRYTDRQLADMGVERGDVVRLAWEEAERRFPLPAEGEPTRAFAKTSAGSLDLALAGQR